MVETFAFEVTITADGPFYLVWYTNEFPIDWDNVDVVP